MSADDDVSDENQTKNVAKKYSGTAVVLPVQRTVLLESTTG